MSEFNRLSGTVIITEDAPAGFSQGEFYGNPYLKKYRHVFRPLIHETFHFWQLFDSGYLAGKLLREWREYCRVRKRPLPEDFVAAPEPPDDPARFTVRELVETHARFWDLQVYNPRMLTDIAEEDGIRISRDARILHDELGLGSFSGEDFDAFMTEGRERHRYGRAYRWWLDEVKKTGVDNYSTVAASLFPIIWSVSFQTDRPASAFEAMCGLTLENQALLDHIPKGSALIPDVQMRCVLVFLDEASRYAKGLGNDLGTGIAVIQCSSLQEHPVYALLGSALDPLCVAFERGLPETSQSLPALDPEHERMSRQIDAQARELAMYVRLAPFTLPGLGRYRGLLSEALCPPFIWFRNGWQVSVQPEHKDRVQRDAKVCLEFIEDAVSFDETEF